MRIWIFSDLHLDQARPDWVPPAIPDADLAVVAGDVGEGLVESISWLAETVRPHMPVVLVAGNNEYYGGTLPEELALGRKTAALQDVLFLENDTVEFGGCLVSGCTMWTDYGLDGESRRSAAMAAAQAGMQDHSRIAWSREPAFQRFRPTEALELHRRSRAFLTSALATRDPQARSRPHIVVTHHAPSAGSVLPHFEGDPLNPAFASNLEDLIHQAAPALWVHGHTHASFDYAVGATRILCNPMGYGHENPAFNAALVFELAC